MAYVITDTCIKDSLCVEVCPTDCIHPKTDEPGFEAATQMYVDPEGCIDCGACVVTCPTGIDIREGLQMECIHCTQCMDACDSIMDRVGRPRGRPSRARARRDGAHQARGGGEPLLGAGVFYGAALSEAERQSFRSRYPEIRQFARDPGDRRRGGRPGNAPER